MRNLTVKPVALLLSCLLLCALISPATAVWAAANSDRQEPSPVIVHTREEGKAIALAKVRELYPLYADGMREIDEEISINEYDKKDEYTFTLQYYHRDRPVTDMQLDVMVDRYTGVAELLYEVEEMEEMVEFLHGGGYYHQATAEKMLFDMDFELAYSEYWERGQEVIPVYRLKNYRYSTIDARYGRPSYYWYGYGSESIYTASVIWEEVPEEQIPLLIETGQIFDSAQALEIGSKYFDKPWDVNEVEIVLAENPREEGVYSWSIYGELETGDQYEFIASLSIDASSGELLYMGSYDELSYYSGRYSFSGGTYLSEEEAREIADAYIRAEAPDALGHTRVDSVYRYSSYTFRYVRQNNNVPYPENWISIEIDRSSGEVTSFEKNWFKEVRFAPAEIRLTKEKAFEKLCEAGNFTLGYEYKGYMPVGGYSYYYWEMDDYDYVITYAPSYLLESKSYLVIDAKTGELCWSDGSPAGQYVVPKYEDLEDHWAKPLANNLLDQGFYIDEWKFKPDRVITTEEFFEFLAKRPSRTGPTANGLQGIERNYMQDDPFIRMGLTPEKGLRRKEAALIFAEHIKKMGVEIAGEGGSTLLTDSVESRYREAVELCISRGVLELDPEGRFNPELLMTRGEAAEAIHAYLDVLGIL